MSDDLAPLPEHWDRALAVVAHPDDLEYGAASAVARWTSQGKDVRYVLVTRGEAGIRSMAPAETSRVRTEEQVASAAIVGVQVVEFLDHPDGLVVADLALRRDLARAIRRHRPEVVISINFRESWGGTSWNHADHQAVGRALIDACRDAGNPWLFTELADEGLEPWDGVEFVAFSSSLQSTHATDITGFLETGIESLCAHTTYLAELGDDATGSDPGAFLRSGAEAAGRRMGVEHAVTFEMISV